MPDREKVITGCENWVNKHKDEGLLLAYSSVVELLALLKEQENLLKEYEKLSQVCFKIEKYLRIADLSILIDRIEEGKVEVLQDDGRPDSMETTIKIRRM